MSLLLNNATPLSNFHDTWTQTHTITHGSIHSANTTGWSLYDVPIITASLCRLAGGMEPTRAKVIIMTECMKAIYTIERMKQGEITLIGFANTLPRAQNSKNDPIYSIGLQDRNLLYIQYNHPHIFFGIAYLSMQKSIILVESLKLKLSAFSNFII